MQKSTERERKPDPAGTDSEATSKETLSDLEHNEDNVGSGSSTSESGPSPDGTVNERNENNDAGPI